MARGASRASRDDRKAKRGDVDPGVKGRKPHRSWLMSQEWTAVPAESEDAPTKDPVEAVSICIRTTACKGEAKPPRVATQGRKIPHGSCRSIHGNTKSNPKSWSLARCMCWSVATALSVFVAATLTLKATEAKYFFDATGVPWLTRYQVDALSAAPIPPSIASPVPPTCPPVHPPSLPQPPLPSPPLSPSPWHPPHDPPLPFGPPPFYPEPGAPRPPHLPPPLPPPPPRPPPPAELIVKLNARFHRAPWDVQWETDGTLADAGVLVHVTDGWEAGGRVWAPATNGPGATDQSASMIYSEQRRAGSPLSYALFGGGKKGLIFRPGVTKVKCGKSTDSSGKCLAPCPTRAKVDLPWNEGLDKFCAWPPANFGLELHRLTIHQTKWHHLWYNEIVIDAKYWASHLPNIVEAVFGERGFHEAFLRTYGLSPSTHPFVSLRDDWDTPFY